MLQTFLEMLIYYWPKLIAALYFAFLNTWIMKNYKNRTQLVGMAISLFFISSAFLSIPAEFLFTKAYNGAMHLINYSDESNIVYIFWSSFSDYLVVFLGTLAYIKIVKLKPITSATVYLEYVCIERLCMVLAIDQLSYLIIYALLQAVFFALMHKDLSFMMGSTSIRWDRVLLYLCGLLFILDSLYAAYYLFPELGTNVINAPTLLWIDSVALITFAFILGFMKLSIHEGKLHDSRLNYMRKFQEGQEHIIQTFAEISEANSGETGQHVKRVAEYCHLIATELGVDEDEAACIRVAAMMHDVGKLMIPREIIEKPGKLTEEEYEIVKTHTTYGDKLLSRSDGHIMQMARVIALQHHEHWDGSGYPQGLSGDDINIYAQIASVADVYDALASDRAYKTAWDPKRVKEEILRKRGSQFSPDVVDAFANVYTGMEEIRLQYQDECSVSPVTYSQDQSQTTRMIHSL